MVYMYLTNIFMNVSVAFLNNKIRLEVRVWYVYGTCMVHLPDLGKVYDRTCTVK